MKKNKWMPEQGETFYFIYHSEYLTSIVNKEYVKLNIDYEALVIGQAECCFPEYDTESNCFRTKDQAKKALNKIREALKFTGE